MLSTLRSTPRDALARLRAVPVTRAATIAGLVICLVAGFALRAHQASAPAGHLSADERAYGRVALALSTGEGYGDAGMRDPYQWAPGAPALFALARRVGPGGPAAGYRIAAAYWAQAVVGTLMIGAAFALASLLGGTVAGLAAAAAVAFYPPLIQTAGHQLSEPLGALLLTAALAALAWAQRRHSARRLALCGALLGLTVLTRADLVLAPLLVAGVVAACMPLRAGAHPRLRAAAALLLPALAVIAPWTIAASTATGRFVPVSDGGTSALYVGTYLPGDGTLAGLKRKLARETRRAFPVETRGKSALQLPAEKVLKTVAARHPQLPERVALRNAAMHNLSVYALGRPGPFAAMMARKVARMWWQPVVGTHDRGHSTGTATLIVHRLLLAGALLGLVAGLWRRRDGVLIAIVAIAVYSTLDNAILIAEARHNVPLLASLYAAGAGGWALAVRAHCGGRAAQDTAIAR